jgi:hypothetical protein
MASSFLALGLVAHRIPPAVADLRSAHQAARAELGQRRVQLRTIAALPHLVQRIEQPAIRGREAGEHRIAQAFADAHDHRVLAELHARAPGGRQREVTLHGQGHAVERLAQKPMQHVRRKDAIDRHEIELAAHLRPRAQKAVRVVVGSFGVAHPDDVQRAQLGIACDVHPDRRIGSARHDDEAAHALAAEQEQRAAQLRDAARLHERDRSGMATQHRGGCREDDGLRDRTFDHERGGSSAEERQWSRAGSSGAERGRRN